MVRTVIPHNTIERTPEDDLALKHARRQRELELRKLTLKYWKQRDSKKIAELKAIWAERDRQTQAERRQRLWDCTCSICRHPFVMYRKPRSEDNVYCADCRLFLRLQRKRNTYRKRAQLAREYRAGVTTLAAAQPNPQKVTDISPETNNKPSQPEKLTGKPRLRSGPVVVWAPAKPSV